MTVSDQSRIIDNKIEPNQAQYDLNRLTAKITPLSPGELRKYEYLTGKDLGYRPRVLEQTKFDYSPLDKVFDKGLDDKDDQKEGILKRLKNIEKIKTSSIIITMKENQVVQEVNQVKKQMMKIKMKMKMKIKKLRVLFIRVVSRVRKVLN